VPDPVGADLLGADPGKEPADPFPEVVVPSAGDRLATLITQQLPVVGGVAVPAVLDEPGHEGRGDGLPADGFAFLAEPDQALVGVEIVGAQR